ncbi:hypothetical protein [Nostoc sp. 2RC]|uniref:hypothetical protein n=1 Tax=Nostoc sp. 2RC TaxID=2485484 RepID=UPI001625E8C0|nr:hypothetical protein [Nostoc sp. 2RC]MBC1238522.1 hypothetical protein [Nostoc sp. 2RC]
MNNLITCIECGHNPISTQASQCPKCSKNPHGQVCKICFSKVAQSKAIVRKQYFFEDQEYFHYGRWAKKLDDGCQDNYYHQSCIDKLDTILYKCPTCSFINTKFSKSCLNCGQPFKTVYCNYCYHSLLEVIAVKGDNILGEGKFFHSICANSIRPFFEETARKDAILEQERKRKQAEEAIIRERERKEQELRDEERKINEEIDRKNREKEYWWRERGFSSVLFMLVSGYLSFITYNSFYWFSLICGLYSIIVFLIILYKSIY